MAEPARKFHTQQIHYLRKTVLFSNTATQLTVGTVPAGAVLLTPLSGAVVTTAFNDSGTDFLDIGTSTTGDLFATDLDVSSLGFKACDESVAGALFSVDTVITATYTGQNGNATTGAAEVVIAFIPDNDK
jgi:hypothetical protein